ncbi:MAG: transcriptional initiation protein Tat, partial [Archangiaceae bacterium]|nr:transcriptional initiation protein Tat [Archangiaceae bacterium]
MISRRRLIQSLALFGAAPVFAQTPSKKTLVVVFLRGGVDGLSMVPPLGDPQYAPLRPSLRVKGLPLDSMFGLHPSMAPLEPLFRAKRLAIVHATGLPNAPRSHFEAQDFLESGTPGRRAPEGWLNRAGRDLPASPFSMVAVQNALPLSMGGDSRALAFPSLKDFRVAGGDAAATTFEALYDQAVDDALRTSG